MPQQKPYRLKIPSVQARSARSAFEDEACADINDIKVTHVPIVQWTSYRIRCLVVGAAATLNIAYVRPARQTADPTSPESGGAYEYTTGQPAVATLALVDGVEGILDVLAAEHLGENWLQVEIDPAAALNITFVDLSGENVGTYQ